ncbi:aspartyl/asparaginyl beta-hydroxylase domain-containing protein [Simiduia aestuariiviva]|uniref:Aspartyl/asparaginy/proline hydroxylase domain-containing protein n=1 Tax=Simiduia aestuariiviva TaxID=1510459 RepID=A0A839UMW0_9GAMM|nr:aspartyl/asparaginyl beta-hydroxylase domain-containing protein [Simiduia aestuariiviva]MBB3169182.1 hypothetical protein [Simiduia aestuariiviva]
MTANKITPAIEYSWQQYVKGDRSGALTTVFKEYQRAPQNALALLFLSTYCNDHQLEEAACAASIADELNGASLFLWSSNGVPDPIRHASKISVEKLNQFLASKHVDHTKNSTVRIQKSCWAKNQKPKPGYLKENQSPHLFFIPDLPSNGWHDTSGLEWHKYFCEKIDSIRKEIISTWHNNQMLGRPYLKQPPNKEFVEISSNKNWESFDLYLEGKRCDFFKNLEETEKALEQAPLFCIDENPEEVFLSILKSGQKIPPHYGLGNHALTIHCPIIIPDSGCSITVNKEKKHWNQRDLLAFDDSFIHHAENESQDDRVVLIFSVWHPDLKNTEIADLQSIFKKRKLWLKKRNDKLASLG